MRVRHSAGGIRKQRGKWIGHWYAGGTRKSRVLGLVSEMTKTKAREEVAKIAAAERAEVRDEQKFGSFVEDVYFPFYGRKWKKSTDGSTRNRIEVHLLDGFRNRELLSFNRNELQEFLDEKAKTLSFSTVAHLRWDLKAIFDLALSENLILRNPALLLFIPKEAAKPKHPVMTIKEVKKCLGVLEERERLIAKLALAGLRPGEIFALTWGEISDCVNIKQRVYRGVLDTPKTTHSERKAALPDGLKRELAAWKAASGEVTDKEYVFPSENMTPLQVENVWRRSFKPRLEKAGLGWVNFQVMRRTAATLLNSLGVRGKIVADQLGHTLDVSQNVYTQSPVGERRKALNRLERQLKP